MQKNSIDIRYFRQLFEIKNERQMIKQHIKILNREIPVIKLKFIKNDLTRFFKYFSYIEFQ